MAEGKPIKFEEIADLVPGLEKATAAIKSFETEVSRSLKNLANQAEAFKKALGSEKVGSEGFNQAAQGAERLKTAFDGLKNAQKIVLNGFGEGKQRLKELRAEQNKLNLKTQDGKKRFDELQSEIVQTSTALQALTAETKRSAKAAQAANNSYDKMSVELQQAKRQLKQLDNAFDKNTGKINKSNEAAVDLNNKIQRLSGNLKKFDKTIGDNFRNVGNYEQALGKAVGGVKNFAMQAGLAIGVTAALARGFQESIRIFRDFGLVMSKVQAVTGATDEEFKQLEADAKRLGASTFFTASQVGELQLNFAKLGFSTQEILKATEATLALATATDSDLATAAEVAGSTVRAFQLDASETGRVTDVMAASFTKSALDIENFRESMKLVAPIANAANIPIETTTALLGKLADSGLKGSIAGTGLRNVLGKLTDPTSDLAKALGSTVNNSDDLFKAFKKLKASNIDLAKATELTDERSKAAFITLVNGIDSAEDLKTALDGSAGAAAGMAETVGDNLEGDIRRLISAFEGLILEGGALNRFLRVAVKGLTKFIELISGAETEGERFLRTMREATEQQEEFENTLKAEEIALQGIKGRLLDVNTSQEDRNTLINLVNKEYGEYLPNLVDESDSLEEIEQKLNAATEAMIKRQVLAREEEKISEAISKQVDDIAEFTKLLGDSEKELNANRKRAIQLQEVLDELSAGDVSGAQELAEALDISGSDFATIFENANKALEVVNLNIDELQGEVDGFNNGIERTKGIDFVSIIRGQFDALLKSFGLVRDELDKTLDDIEGKEVSLIGDGEEEKERLTARQKAILEVQKEFEKDFEDIQDTRLTTIENTNNSELLSVEQKQEAIEEQEKQFADEQLRLQIRLAKDKLFLLETFGKEESQTQTEFDIELLKAQEKVNTLEIEQEKNKFDELKQVRQDGLDDEAQDLKDRQDELKKLADSPVTEGLIRGFEELTDKRIEEDKRAAQEIENDEARQAALDQIAKKEFNRELGLAAIQAYQSELSQSGDTKEALKAANDALIAGVLVKAIAGFKKGGYTGDGGVDEVAGVTHGKEFVVDAQKTKELGLKGKSMSDFDRMYKSGEFAPNLEDVYAQTSDALVMSQVQVVQSGFTEKEARMIGKEVAKSVPDMTPIIKDLDGHMHRLYIKNNLKERNTYKNPKSPLR